MRSGRESWANAAVAAPVRRRAKSERFNVGFNIGMRA
jgi:hypothetical protein